MNTDHAGALVEIVRDVSGREPESAALIAVDPEGFHVRTGHGVAYVTFPRPCWTSDEVRAGMIELVTAARS